MGQIREIAKAVCEELKQKYRYRHALIGKNNSIEIGDARILFFPEDVICGQRCQDIGTAFCIEYVDPGFPDKLYEEIEKILAF